VKRYPLEPLGKVREAHVDGATTELAAAVDAREDAEARRVAAETSRADARKEALATQAKEREALERGELTVADLMRENAWELRVRAEDAALAEKVARAAEGEAAAIDDETRARQLLAEKKADAKVVENDRDRWSVQEKKRADAKEEEDAAEGWRKKEG
jgi:hypothetical protein